MNNIYYGQPYIIRRIKAITTFWLHPSRSDTWESTMKKLGMSLLKPKPWIRRMGYLHMHICWMIHEWIRYRRVQWSTSNCKCGSFINSYVSEFVGDKLDGCSYFCILVVLPIWSVATIATLNHPHNFLPVLRWIKKKIQRNRQMGTSPF